jgi:hypothetical protein
MVGRELNLSGVRLGWGQPRLSLRFFVVSQHVIVIQGSNRFGLDVLEGLGVQRSLAGGVVRVERGMLRRHIEAIAAGTGYGDDVLNNLLNGNITSLLSTFQRSVVIEVKQKTSILLRCRIV